jgi:acetyltransferase
MGFSGEIYPVNPRYDEIEGLTCYASVLDVPDPVDLAIIFITAPLVPKAIRECVERGIKGAMIESGGFAETGEDGRSLQDTLQQIVRNTGIRLWGPNCMGLVDTVNGYVFSFVAPTIWDDGLTKGDVSLIVQSGMLSGGFLIDTMSHGTMGVNKVCSIGNKVDVNECELLESLMGDPRTKAVGLYLESVSDGRRFLEICSRSQKPIVVVKGAKSANGARAALSHTASLSGNGIVLSGAFAQVGVVEASDFKQMMDLCRALAMFPELPAQSRGRVAIITYTGAGGILSSDFMDKMGLELAGISQNTRDVMKCLYPDWMPVMNPFDLWPAVERHGAERVYFEAVRAVCADPNVDAILLHSFVGGFAFNPDMAAMANEARAAGKPMFCWLLGKCDEARKFHIHAQECGVPVYRELYRAVECMAAVFARNKSLERRRELVRVP